MNSNEFNKINSGLTNRIKYFIKAFYLFVGTFLYLVSNSEGYEIYEDNNNQNKKT